MEPTTQEGCTATLDRGDDRPHADQSEAEAGRTEWTPEQMRDLYDQRRDEDF